MDSDNTPEGGADKFRDTWVPTPFLTKVYDAEAKTYTMEFRLPKQLLLVNPQWQAMVHDEVLRYADRDGVILEGQIVITEREGGTDTVAATLDPTIDRDATVSEVLMDPDKEPEVAEEQAKVERPDIMSPAEQAMRKRLRDNMRETEQALFGFTSDQLDGRPLPQGREFKVDRKAFQEGFFGVGGPKPEPTLRDFMIVTCEAMVSMSLGSLDAEPLTEPAPDDSSTVASSGPDGDQFKGAGSLSDLLDQEIPDDLSGLDDH